MNLWMMFFSVSEFENWDFFVDSQIEWICDYLWDKYEFDIEF